MISEKKDSIQHMHKVTRCPLLLFPLPLMFLAHHVPPTLLFILGVSVVPVYIYHSAFAQVCQVTPGSTFLSFPLFLIYSQILYPAALFLPGLLLPPLYLCNLLMVPNTSFV